MQEDALTQGATNFVRPHVLKRFQLFQQKNALFESDSVQLGVMFILDGSTSLNSCPIPKLRGNESKGGSLNHNVDAVGLMSFHLGLKYFIRP